MPTLADMAGVSGTAKVSRRGQQLTQDALAQMAAQEEAQRRAAEWLLSQPDAIKAFLASLQQRVRGASLAELAENPAYVAQAQAGGGQAPMLRNLAADVVGAAGEFAPSRLDVATAGLGKLAALGGKAGMVAGAISDVTPAFLKNVKPPVEDISDVASSNFDHYRVLGNKTVPIDTLEGGVRESSASDIRRVDALKNKMQDQGGYIERLIVDDSGNVIEGQHRLEALRKIGVKNVPVVVIKDLEQGRNIEAMREAVRSVSSLHPDEVTGIIREALRSLDEYGTAEKALAETYLPPQFAKAYEAAVNAGMKQ